MSEKQNPGSENLAEESSDEPTPFDRFEALMKRLLRPRTDPSDTPSASEEQAAE